MFRDVVYIISEICDFNCFDLIIIVGIIDVVFYILCNVNVVRKGDVNFLVVCWGGYFISCEEYDFIKEVGYELGLWDMNIIIGCGLGVMKGLMKGVVIGYVK